MLTSAVIARHGATSKRIASRLEATGVGVIAVARDVTELGDRLGAERPDLTVHCCPATAAEAKRDLLALKRALPQVPVVAVVRDDGTGGVSRTVLEASVEGLVHSARVADALAPTVRAVAAGQIVLPQSEYRRAVPVVLSHRERQVLRLAVEGLTNDAIAKTLYLSCSTVKSHLTSAFAKLSVRSRSEAAVVLLNPDEPASRLGFNDVAGDVEPPPLAVASR
ncbi:MAG TPA: response regulator transcription factor [Solirubrobacterales bacterium]|nr:response regulator transcription factor [Solirubrobacterales bacterium]